MITFNDGTAAFDAAIASGRLSAHPSSPVYAGHFMYMGTNEHGDMFKHCDTRRYLPFLPGDRPGAAFQAVSPEQCGNAIVAEATGERARAQAAPGPRDEDDDDGNPYADGEHLDAGPR